MQRELGMFLLIFIYSALSYGQGLHFSQYQNSPLLLNPANTALMPDDDFRAGMTYRSQWEQVPAPFKTFAAFTDYKVLKNEEETNWMGLGAAFYNDKAGNGDLSLTKVQLNVAYHMSLSMSSMLSFGMGIAYVQRSVDFNKLTYDVQWDGFKFDKNQPHQENYSFQKTSYPDIAAGLNYALFPNDNFYMKLGLGMEHINRPKESFYKQDNRIAFRPTADLNMVFRLNDRWIGDISAYYTTQRSSYEAIVGGKISSNVAADFGEPTILNFGCYYRLNDAIIPAIGLEWYRVAVWMATDITMGGMSKATNGWGALEISILYKGLYEKSKGKDRSGFGCPRF